MCRCDDLKYSLNRNVNFNLLTTVGLGTMAQPARLWALPVAKLVGQSKIASNITLGKLIGLHHIQSTLLYNKICNQRLFE